MACPDAQELGRDTAPWPSLDHTVMARRSFVVVPGRNARKQRSSAVVVVLRVAGGEPLAVAHENRLQSNSTLPGLLERTDSIAASEPRKDWVVGSRIGLDAVCAPSPAAQQMGQGIGRTESWLDGSHLGFAQVHA